MNNNDPLLNGKSCGTCPARDPDVDIGIPMWISGSSVVGRQAGAESFLRLPIPMGIGNELWLVGGRDRTLRQSLNSLLAPAVPPAGGFLDAAEWARSRTIRIT
jgi:hypothetical protein